MAAAPRVSRAGDACRDQPALTHGAPRYAALIAHRNSHCTRQRVQTEAIMEARTTPALDAAKQQLAYWREQRDIAAREGEAKRLAQCDRFIAQCELVISALNAVQPRR
jgi:hypothetical protein